MKIDLKASLSTQQSKSPSNVEVKMQKSNSFKQLEESDPLLHTPTLTHAENGDVQKETASPKKESPPKKKGGLFDDLDESESTWWSVATK